MQGVTTRFNLSKQSWRGLVILAFLLTFIAWLLNTPPGLLGKADAIGYAVCHRIEVRSFFMGEIQLPLCARCSGMYLGAVVGLVYQWLVGRKRIGMPSWQIIVPISIFVLLFILDGLNSFFSLFANWQGLYQPNNVLRLLTGTGMGLAIAVALFPAFNATVWQRVDRRTALINFGSFLLMVVLAFGFSALVLSGYPVILYPLALISAAGVVVLLTLVYAMILLMVFKVENRYNQINQLIFVFIGGLTLSLIQIGALDFIRYVFTGTWDGFHI